MSGQSVCLAKADKMWLIAAYQTFKKRFEQKLVKGEK